ncbi:MAG: tetratricopeptide repeat protein [Phycisphaerales bacterium]|nr:MAG: tetratricopeptide repeat protein [Phycisphaerales bacterium]UCF15703.1 MAG: tetratricopeptide repeat protein [Phycisphaerales bacterium]
MRVCARVAIVIGMGLQCLALLFFAGCGQQQSAVSLYVDAVTLREAGEIKDAIKKLNEAIEADGEFSLAYSLLCKIHQDLKEYEKSASACEMATHLNPWSFEDQFNLGWDYLMMRKSVLAARALSKACELEPDHLAANINAAMAHYEIGDFTKALEYAERVEKIDPQTAGIQQFLTDLRRVIAQRSSPGLESMWQARR